MANVTTVREYLLLGFSEVRELQLVHLLVYLVALTGNLLIFVVTVFNRRLHTSMYFFLRHLSVLDLCLISVTVPKSISNAVINSRSISSAGCGLQVLFFTFCACSEVGILMAMSYDRCVAICWPPCYDVIMAPGACGKMALASWLSGQLMGILHVSNIFSLPFCGPAMIHHFFCDVPQVLKLVCPGDTTGEVGVICLIDTVAFFSLILIVYSYVSIFWAVLRMPSTEGWPKAFSTCLPHLIVVTLFLSSGGFEYLNPVPDSPSLPDFLLPVFYAIVPPSLNPVIYSLRNRDIKSALGEAFRGKGICLG
ncbi:olfactory receptor 14J1-like [Ornithorhynchus anatinus]|uniref:Olfactory receptor n=1 Tax=Ornithorhynchus anatinus TaxID=9258 RepID=A0A6I8NSX7_ORNAN|nr:olfactory receptor 14J1-like [Ornithorhynchus anatinus]